MAVWKKDTEYRIGFGREISRFPLTYPIGKAVFRCQCQWIFPEPEPLIALLPCNAQRRR
jgi:hypothetical protein